MHLLICRYLASDSTVITTYGFVDVDFKNELCLVKHKPGSYYFFIPQVNFIFPSTAFYSLILQFSTSQSDASSLFLHVNHKSFF